MSKTFEVTDVEGDSLCVTRFARPGGLPNVCILVNESVVHMTREQTAELRKWLNGLYGQPVIAKSDSGPEKPDDADDCESPEHQARVSDVDKLRLLAAVVDTQAPFGTDLADFKRRLQIVLGL